MAAARSKKQIAFGDFKVDVYADLSRRTLNMRRAMHPLLDVMRA